MNTPEFIDRVRQMREAQRNYFNTRSPASLNQAKALEKLVDGALREMSGGPTLFFNPDLTRGGRS